MRYRHDRSTSSLLFLSICPFFLPNSILDTSNVASSNTKAYSSCVLNGFFTRFVRLNSAADSLPSRVPSRLQAPA